jgi:hypothetical protein
MVGYSHRRRRSRPADDEDGMVMLLKPTARTPNPRLHA